jgi:hypothetical protein
MNEPLCLISGIGSRRLNLMLPIRLAVRHTSLILFFRLPVGQPLLVTLSLFSGELTADYNSVSPSRGFIELLSIGTLGLFTVIECYHKLITALFYVFTFTLLPLFLSIKRYSNKHITQSILLTILARSPTLNPRLLALI